MSKCVKCVNEILTGDIHWEMGLCNNCYNELYKDHKTHISLDKMWLKLAQDFRDENEKLQDKVADLEAKFAESEKKAYNRGHSQRNIANEIKLNALKEDVANKEKRIVELKQQLEKSEKSKESYRLQNEHHHLQLLQFYSRLGVEAFGADIHEKALETLMIMKEQLAEKDLAIENWQTMYKSVVQTCHNDKEEIERLNNQLETQENTITNIIEDNRASQEWYKKQLEEKEKERHEEWKTGKEWKWEWQKVNQKLEKADQDKISFAVEKLEQVKETTECVLDNALKNSSLNQSYYDRLIDEIDNQINVLRNNKDGIH